MREFSPYERISQVPLKQIQAYLEQELFLQWGVPSAIRVDNGSPFGSPNRYVVPPLALWLIGIGVQVIWNPPRSPKSNAKVERMQGTSSRWADLKNCHTLKQLQENLKEVAEFQRNHFPVTRLNNQTRVKTFARLGKKSKKYRPTLFRVKRVYEFLATCTFKRTIHSNGGTHIYKYRYQVGRPHANKEVQLKFNVQNRSWHIIDQQGKILKEIFPTSFTPTDIRHLTISKNSKMDKKTQKKN